MTHEAVIGTWTDEDQFGDVTCGIEIVCECGAILMDTDEELLPFSEISDTVRAHKEECENRG